MRPVSILFVGAILLLFAPVPVASAVGSSGCHTWEVYLGDETTGAGASTDDGASILAAAGFYVVNDGLPTDEFLFSIWIYQESNGVSGLQRGDEVCDETNGEGWPYSDGGCIC